MKYLLLALTCFSLQNFAHASLINATANAKTNVKTNVKTNTMFSGAASIDGDWRGWGDWTYEGSGDRCDMRFVFQDAPTQLLRRSGQISCMVVSMSIPNQAFMKHGQDLLVDNVVVGHMIGDHIELHENYSPTVKLVTNITVSGLHLDYEEIWYQHDGSVLYKINGRLFKHQ